MSRSYELVVQDKMPTYKLANISKDSTIKMYVKPEALPPVEIKFVLVKQEKPLELMN
ncbi:hypothetical protein K2173_020746 [Erythroxylum novogranatense]|uniref:Uncharacterized protein n=1 Tax=Erythroxylum novogranatense TaxID=1862640 RepID=A0AAV8TMZ1_9ROSI|nr:hypothetical protein K2173_020746 [Erythroxylum novogranatense]